MTLPANWSTVTVTGTYLNIDGEPLKGAVAFSTTTRVVDAGANVTVPPSVRRVSLDKDGKFSVVLPATDDPDVAPTGFTYRVDEDLVLPTGARSLTNYLIQLPAAAAAVDLADVVPVTAVGEVSPYLRKVDIGTTAGTVAAGDDSRILGAAQRSALPANVKDFGVKGDGSEEGSAIQAALTTILNLGRDVYFPPGTYKSNAGLAWDPTRGSVVGCGQVTLDFTGLASGYAITLDCADATATFRAIEHSIGGFRVLGTEDDNATVDGFRFVGAANSSQIGLRDLRVVGFRDQFFFGQNTWCVTFYRVIAGHWSRYSLNFDSTTNAGENYNFYGCSFFNAKNTVTGTATAVYTSPTGDVDATFHSCSFDYNDYAVLHQGGKLWFAGCHFEDNGANPFIRLTRTSDPSNPRTTMGLFGGVFVQTESGNGRDHLIQVMSGTVNEDVYLSMHGVVFDTQARTTTVFKNLSAAKPRVTHFGCQLANTGSGTQSATMGQYTNLLVNGDFEGSTTFAGGSFPLYPGQNWSRGGTIVYSFDTAVKRSGTTSLKMVGTGVAINSALQQMFSVIPGRELLVTFWVRTESMTGGNVSGRVAWYLNDHSTRLTVAYQSAFIAASQDWTAYQVRLVVPPGISVALIDFVNSNLNGSVYVDDVCATMP